MSNYNPYEGGKAAFARGSRPNPTDDKKFMEYYSNLSAPSGEGSELQGTGRALREAKQEAMLEFKKGWVEAKVDAEKPEEPVAKKKTTKKKTSKKKVSKKKSKK